MELTDFTSSIIYLINTCEEIISLTGNDDRNVHPYWVRTFKSFSKAIMTKISDDYMINKTPEEKKFTGLKEKFRNIYEIFSDEFSNPLTYQVDGKNRVNDSWLKIEGDISDGEFCSEDPPQDSSLTKNRGLVINIFTPSEEQKKKGSVNIEFASSEFYRASIYIDRNVTKKPRYPYCLIYAIYNCIKYSGLNDIDPVFLGVIDDIYSRRIEILEKEQTNIDKAIASVKNQFTEVLGDTTKEMSGILDQIRDGLEELNDDTIENIALEAHSAVKAFDKNKTGSVKEFVQTLTGSSNEHVEKTMGQIGLGESNIARLIDAATGRNTNNVKTNNELLGSIPMDIDSFINGR